MATLNSNVAIKVPICEETSEGRFDDAIYFTPEEFASMTDEEVESRKAERVANWVAKIQEFRKNPPPPSEPFVFPPPRPDNLG